MRRLIAFLIRNNGGVGECDYDVIQKKIQEGMGRHMALPTRVTTSDKSVAPDLVGVGA